MTKSLSFEQGGHKQELKVTLALQEGLKLQRKPQHATE